jgi:hypothetical protein
VKADGARGVEIVFEFLRFADGPVVHSEARTVRNLAEAHAYASVGLYNVSAYQIVTSYRLRDAESGEIVATAADAPGETG